MKDRIIKKKKKNDFLLSAMIEKIVLAKYPI